MNENEAMADCPQGTRNPADLLRSICLVQIAVGSGIPPTCTEVSPEERLAVGTELKKIMDLCSAHLN